MKSYRNNMVSICRAALLGAWCVCWVLHGRVLGQGTPTEMPMIDIYFSWRDSADFPKHWLEPPISFKADGLDTTGKAFCIQVFERFVRRYPYGFVNFFANRFAFFSAFEMDGRQMAYVSRDKWIVIWVAEGISKADEVWLESALHFSFAHHLFLLEDNSSLENRFKALLPTGYRYPDRAFLPDLYADDNFDLEPRLHAFGFATVDGTYTFERDFFGIASQLFMGREAFRKAVFEHPRLMQKALLVIELYKRFDSDMDAAWFLNRPVRKKE
jgi:hypothetical protein